jgi:hypothetical protein
VQNETRITFPLTSAIPNCELYVLHLHFSLDTVFPELYTFVNCKLALQVRCQNRKRENRNNGNQESSSEEASEEGSQEGSQEEVSKQTQQATHSGGA